MKQFIIYFVNLLAKTGILSPIKIAKLRYWYILRKWPNLKRPTDLNEKINYLKFYGDTSKWPMLTDKYAVRQYIKNLGLEDILVKLYGKWDNAENIEWEKLPNEFVMKCNNGCGDILICKDKNKLNIPQTTMYLKKTLNKGFGIISGEPHYSQIKPCIIAEELLDVNKQNNNSSSLVDYKIWCINGKVENIFCCFNRKKFCIDVELYDREWNPQPQFLVYTKHCKKPSEKLPKPIQLNEMIKIAEKLSTGFPILRVDLYEVDRKIYFGELTFTSQSGCMDYFTQEYLNLMGSKVKL